LQGREDDSAMTLPEVTQPTPLSEKRPREFSPVATDLVCEPLPWRTQATALSTAALIAADLLAAGMVALFADRITETLFGAVFPLRTFFATSLFWMALRFFYQLYPAHGIAAPEEFRRASITTLLASLSSLTLFSVRHPSSMSAGAVTLAWLFLIPFGWLARGVAKWLLVNAGLYGKPMLIVGAGRTAALVIRELRANPGLGLVPVASFDDDPATHGKSVEGVPVLGDLAAAGDWIPPYPIADVILAMPSAGGRRIVDIATRLSRAYPNVGIVADLFGLGNIWVRPQSLGNCIALEVPHHRFDVRKRVLKRAFDLAIGFPLFVVSIPVVMVCAALVRIVDWGPALYAQRRQGAHGHSINVWKIRTMVVNADEQLERHLSTNPTARAEWDRQMKLREDPRILPRLGRFLRKSSLDELPQLWSVVKGDMSLVGPRPFPEYHLSRFDDEFRSLRTQVPPGITGFWQITDRSDGDLRAQRSADSYYIQNWSLWLDLWILLRTVDVVLRRKGAR
jgi:Undecaprenyl-phosphate galactose phosphotransferase WbaP